MATPNLSTENIGDRVVQDNLLKITEFLSRNPFSFGDFRDYTITFTKSGGETKVIPHKLGFQPNCVFQVFLSKYLDTSAGTVTWNYDSFTDEFISVTNSGVGVLRAIIGRISSSGA